MQSDATRHLIDELDAFAALLGAVSGLRGRDDADRLRELVRYRPQLAASIIKLRDVGAAALRGTDEALAEEYRSRLSVLQRGMLLLQADWPAPAIAERAADYAAAAARVADTNRAFIAWARAAAAR